MIKKTITLILAFILFFQTTVLGSDNWVNVESKNGNNIYINTSNFSIIDDIVTFQAKANIKNHKYIYVFSVDCKEKTIFMNEMSEIKNNNEKEVIKLMEKFGEFQYPKPNSLNESMIMFIDDSTKYDIRRQNWDDWLKYHVKVMKKFKKEWNPKFNKDRYKYKIYITSELTIDKNGNITNYTIDMSEEENYKYMIDTVKNDPEIINSIEKAICKVKKVGKLPKSFKGDFIKVKLAFIYNYNKDFKTKDISVIDEKGYNNLLIYKHENKEKTVKLKKFNRYTVCYNLKKFCKTIGEVLLAILLFPFLILIAFFSG